jgi:diacylglycerol kinase family enzyme
MDARRTSALVSLLCVAAAVVAAIVVFVAGFPRGLTVLALIALAALAAWYAVRRRGTVRIVGVLAAVACLVGVVVVVIAEGKPLANVLVLVAFLIGLAAARVAFRVHAALPPAPPPDHPVMFYNPLSGGGKAERFHLADEARRRGIKPIELRHGDDLEQLVRAAVRDGAGALSMAGGDGSQAIVERVAAELGLPYACIPSGTRNHFALDLGVDRDDVVGALDAFVGGGERRVDLAEVNGQVFVNNVSLGLYAEAVQQEGYRDAKIRTLIETVPDAIGPGAEPPRLTWRGPEGAESGAAILVSNNRYRLGSMIGSGTRPRLDGGELGIAVIGPERGDGRRGNVPSMAIQQWTDDTFEVQCDGPVAAGIDGEAMMLDPPLRFRSVPGALRVRIAPQHPGASPSAIVPDSPWETIGALAKLAFTRSGLNGGGAGRGGSGGGGSGGGGSGASLPGVTRK